MAKNPPGALILIAPKGKEFTHGSDTWTAPPENTLSISRKVFSQWSHNIKRLKYSYESESNAFNDFGPPYVVKDKISDVYVATATSDESIQATKHPFPANIIYLNNKMEYKGQYDTSLICLKYDRNDGRRYLPYQIFPFIHRDKTYISHFINLDDVESNTNRKYKKTASITPTKFTITESNEQWYVPEMPNDDPDNQEHLVSTYETTISLEIIETFYS